MKKALKIGLVIGIFAILAGTSIGLVFAFSPADNSTLEVVNVTTQPGTDTVNIVIACEEDETGQSNQHQYRNNYAYMHKIEFKFNGSEDVLYEQEYKWQHRHKLQLGKNMMYQYQIEGLEAGQVLQFQIQYNNGKMLQYTFQV